jgi:hypothetical protein
MRAILPQDVAAGEMCGSGADEIVAVRRRTAGIGPDPIRPA